MVRVSHGLFETGESGREKNEKRLEEAEEKAELLLHFLKACEGRMASAGEGSYSARGF